jgi:opacity protein-like surface antigen
MRKALVLGVLGLAGTLASPAFADDFSGFRLGMNMGSDTLRSQFFFEPFLDTDEINTNRLGYALMAGWGLNRYLAFEGVLRGGSDFNAKPFQGEFVDPADYISSHTNVKGAEVSVVGSLWIGNKFSFFARAGMFAWKADESVSVGNYDAGTKVTASADDTGFDPLFGVGIQSVLDRALIRVEYKQTEIGDLGLAGGFNLHDSTISQVDFSVVWFIH